MSEAKKSKLIDACTAFAVRGARKTLREFQRLQDWVNWSFNFFRTFVLLESYKRISDNEWLNAPIRVNNAMRHELWWFISCHMLKLVKWSPCNRMASTHRVFWHFRCWHGYLVSRWAHCLSMPFACWWSKEPHNFNTWGSLGTHPIIYRNSNIFKLRYLTYTENPTVIRS